MKHKDKIFQILRSAVENPQELADVNELICKIERKMPPIEIIDDTHRKFNGVTYHKDKNIGRYTAKIPLHRAVWSFFNGEIPPGFNIHHIDFDKENDDISNFQCLTKSEHWKIHGKINGAVQATKKIKFICVACGKEFEKVNTGNNLYCSIKCRENYSRNVLHQKIFTCLFCGKEC